MNQDAGGGRTRWQYASDAVSRAVKQLPAADLLSIGSFADNVHWWSYGKPVADTSAEPPEDVRPRGRTDLDEALRLLATAADANVPTHALVATDARATIDNAESLGRELSQRRVTLHVLLIGDPDAATALPALQTITAATGGTTRIERLPEDWAAGLREMLRAATPAYFHGQPATVLFLGPLASHGTPLTAPWNRTWLKPGATALAEQYTPTGERVPMAARWNVGEGRVAAVAFSPGPPVVDSLAKLVERPPRDPRFKVSWETSPTLRVTVDAVDGSCYLNGERFTLELTGTAGGQPTRRDLEQLAPGRYAVEIDAPQSPAFVRVRRDNQTLETFAVAGRYAPEFDAIGNDRAALAELARRTGGAVVEPGVTRPLDIPWPRRSASLVSVLAAAGAALVAAGLVRWRVGS
jgi:hypothetical protein